MLRAFKDAKPYGNFKVLSPDNILMFYCKEKKINWYLTRNLATKIDSNTIKLKFIPNGLGNHRSDKKILDIKNICVNCGSTESLTKHHIVPYCYRKHFPIHYKSHNSYDVLPLCVDCHDNYEIKASELKRELSDKYKLPMNGKYIKNDDFKYKTIANALLNNRNKMPQDRINFIISSIDTYLGRKHTTDDLIKFTEQKPYDLLKPHGELIYEIFRNNIDDFIRTWRKHFIENTSCKYLPEGWNINDN